jgi:TIR domain-containing protein
MSIFISYRRDDTEDVTGRIYDRLVDVFSAQNVVKDTDSIPVGERFGDFILRKITEAEVVLVIIGNSG